MPVTRIDNTTTWEANREAWETVFQDNPNHTPYQSFEWLSAWWTHLGGGELFILRVDDADGQAIGFAPLFLRKSFHGLPLKNLAFIGEKRTDYLDFLVRAGQEATYFAELFAWLHEQRGRYAFIELKDVPGTSSNLPFMIHEIGKHFPLYALESSRICVTVPLEPEWEAFLGRLGKRSRRDVRYDRRYLAKNFETELVEYRNGADVKKGYADLVQIYRQRWVDEKGATRYEDDVAAQFEKAACDALSQKGMYRLWVLYANREPVAGISGYVQNGKLFADVYAHSPNFHKYSVGNVLLGHAIEHCILEGFSEFDLSRGDERYKYRWSGREKRNFHIRLFPERSAMIRFAAVELLYNQAIESKFLQRILSFYRKLRFGK